MHKEQMNIVIVGHVDHGKSTVIGRLLADTKSLPEGKLEQVKAMCAGNSRPFEYAFLLDALKDEQAQGITIDIARCFFKSKKRDYIILDAPGHIEFLKNMVTGAARAEAVLLVIDANEGIQENSKRHGYMVSMLGLKQVTVLINKMDLVDYNQNVFKKIKKEYSLFLKQINIDPVSFIPISAREGDNIASISDKLTWYDGLSVLDQLDKFQKSLPLGILPFRFPVQDVYKFTEQNDNRRIVAGTIETGEISVGDKVKFLPSQKISAIKSIEAFNTPRKIDAGTGESIGFTLTTHIYIRPGEMMVRVNDEQPYVSTRFKANIFWVGKDSMIKNKNYKLKMAADRTPVKLVEIKNVLDTSDLTSDRNKQQIDENDVAECVFETVKPIAFDLTSELENTSRFVIVDNFEIAGGGIILEDTFIKGSILDKHIKERESIWERRSITTNEISETYRYKAKFIVLTGQSNIGKRKIAKTLEKKLFEAGIKVYYLSINRLKHGSDVHIRRLGELARVITDSGQLLITTIDNADKHDINKLKLLNEPNNILVISVGENTLNELEVNLHLEKDETINNAVDKIYQLFKEKPVILEQSQL